MDKIKLKKFDRYRENLTQVNTKIFSYETHVASIDVGDDFKWRIVQHGWWSRTTQKHINYVANHYGYPIVEMDLGKYETGHLNINK